jgi:DNA primase
MLGEAAGGGGESRAGTARRAPGRGRTALRGRPSVVRRAITLLLHHPRAGAGLDPDRLAGLERPGVGLLCDLIETVQKEPDITTAGLLERWRHHEEGRHLGTLAAGELPEEEDFDAAAELDACLDRLALAGRRERIDFLIEKQRVGSLSDEERAELRQIS